MVIGNSGESVRGVSTVMLFSLCLFSLFNAISGVVAICISIRRRSGSKRLLVITENPGGGSTVMLCLLCLFWLF